MRYLNQEEIDIASNFIFLSMAITVLQQDLHYVTKGPFKIKEPYLELIEQMIKLATEKRRKIRKEMYDRNLTVTRIRQDKLFTSYLFVCDRREEERTYFNPVIRKNVLEMMLTLVEDVPQHIRRKREDVQRKRDKMG